VAASMVPSLGRSDQGGAGDDRRPQKFYFNVFDSCGLRFRTIKPVISMNVSLNKDVCLNGLFSHKLLLLASVLITETLQPRAAFHR
jgi:hypothetical protein